MAAQHLNKEGKMSRTQTHEWKKLDEPFRTFIVSGNHTVPTGAVTITHVKPNGSKETARFQASNRTQILSADMLKSVPPIRF